MTHGNAMHRKKRGFTLVELLVVIGILAGLSVMLASATSLDMKSAQRIHCISNLRTIGIGMQKWLAQHDGFYPDKHGGTLYGWMGKGGLDGTYSVANGRGADARILNEFIGGPYAPTDEVPWARCPADRGLWSEIPEYDYRGSSYTPNIPTEESSHDDGKGCVNNAGVGRHYQEIASPQGFITIADSPVFAAIWWSRSQWLSLGGPQLYWHDDELTWPALFADGHAAYQPIRLGKFIGPGYTTWNELTPSP